MKVLVRAIAGIFFVLAVIVWFTQLRPIHSVFASTNSNTSVPNAPLSFSLDTLQASAIAAASTSVPIVTRTGVVAIDASAGQPGTPYLAYEDSNGNFESEEMIFNTNRGCQISAGEADCAPNLSGQIDAGDIQYPVTPGEVISVTGPEIDQTLHVQNFTKQSAVPTNMVVFAAKQGSTVMLSDGVSIRTVAYSDTAACILGIGCFGNGTPQITTVLGIQKDTKTTVFVPGQFAPYSKDVISLLSVTGSQGSYISTFLVAATK